jgi:hypothetical protein
MNSYAQAKLIRRSGRMDQFCTIIYVAVIFIRTLILPVQIWMEGNIRFFWEMKGYLYHISPIQEAKAVRVKLQNLHSRMTNGKTYPIALK